MIVYRLTSPNQKSYIGKTTSNLKRRWRRHISNSSNEDHVLSETKLYRALRKHDPSKWIVEELDQAETIEQLNELEQHYIQKYNTYKNGYNSTEGGDGITPNVAVLNRKEFWSGNAGKKRRKRQSEIMKGNQLAKGKKHNRAPTSEVLEAARQANLKREYSKVSEETKMKISEAQKKRWAKKKLSKTSQ